MTPETWIALAAANFAVSLVPGQNVAFAGAATARGGIAAGVAAVAGLMASRLIWVVLGLSLVLAAREPAPSAWLALQLGGGLFLVAQGATSFLRRPGRASAGGRAFSGRIAVQGFWVGLANPVSLVFFLSLFPMFVPLDAPGQAPVLLAFAVSAVVPSAAAALLPYLTVSRMLAQRGMARALEGLGGAVLLVTGAAALAWPYLGAL